MGLNIKDLSPDDTRALMMESIRALQAFAAMSNRKSISMEPLKLADGTITMAVVKTNRVPNGDGTETVAVTPLWLLAQPDKLDKFEPIDMANATVPGGPEGWGGSDNLDDDKIEAMLRGLSGRGPTTLM